MVGHGQRLALVVGDVDEGDADAPLNRAQLGAHVLAEFQVQRRQRFIQQQHARLRGQGAGDGDALALAAGQFADHFLALARQRDEFQQFLGFFAPRRPARAAHFQREGDVLPHRHQREQRQVLEYQRGRPLVRADAGHVAPADADPALRRFQKAGHGAQQRGFAAAGGAQETEEFALANRDVDVARGDKIAEANPHFIQLHIRAHRRLRLSQVAGFIGNAGDATPAIQHRDATPRRNINANIDAACAQNPGAASMRDGRRRRGEANESQALTNLLRYSVRTSAYHCGSAGHGFKLANASPG